MKRAFTILELLLVLAIIVMIASLAVPSLDRMLAKAEFKEGIIALQTDLQNTRLLAMKSGTPYVLIYRKNTNFYRIFPKSVYDDFLREQNGESKIVGSLTESPDAKTDPLDQFFSLDEHRSDLSEKSLPGKILFYEEQNPEDLLALSPEDSEGKPDESLWIGSLQEPGTTANTESDWSEPVLFQPSGRTSQVFFRLKGSENSDWISEIALRGLTGIARINYISWSGQP
ncbi:MAG: type II secretion system protein [Planctomycetia bacterium]|nr:type II secretion system protein [Planctomycetia bacterium]